MNPIIIIIIISADFKCHYFPLFCNMSYSTRLDFDHYLQVNPLTGPQEGGTIIAISGIDLGQKFDDVLLVTIGGEVCAVEGFEDYYMVGSRYVKS